MSVATNSLDDNLYLLDALGYPNTARQIRENLPASERGHAAAVLADFTVNGLPAHTAILSASDDELPAVVDRLIAAADAR